MNQPNTDHSFDSLASLRRICLVVGSIAAALVLSSFITFGDRSAQATHVDPLFATEVGYPPIPTADNLGALEEINLDQAFWECDHTATRYGVGATDPVRCQAIYDTIKRVRFAGDFDALTVWWKTNRDTEYARLDRVSRVSY